MKILKIYKAKGKTNYMTICIATICDNNSKVIVASDKMITVGGLSQEFEHETPKISQITKNCMAVSAGHALRPNELFRYVKADLQKRVNLSVFEIVQSVKMGFLELRKKTIEEEFFKPRGLTINEFYSKYSNAVHPNIAMLLDDKVQNYDMELEFLVCGVDDEGGHIFHINDPGTSNCFNSLGFWAIGSGTPHSLSTFIANNFNENVPLKDALYITYEAKKRAEKAPGVGLKTDMWIIDKNSIQKVSDEVLSRLESIYQAKLEIEKTETVSIQNKINELKLNGE